MLPIDDPQPTDVARRLKRPLWSRPFWYAGAVLLVVVIGLNIWWTIAPHHSPGDAFRCSMCRSNFKELAYAMHAYRDEHGNFPPAYIADAAGRPMHSWRVLLLPYLGERALYDDFRLNEPWDSPHNLGLANRMPRVYACPTAELVLNEPWQTVMIAVTGPGTAFDGARSCPLSEMQDGSWETLLLAESGFQPVLWLEPRDVSLTEYEQAWSADVNLSPHGRTINILIVDGSVRTFPAEHGFDRFRKLALIADGEAIEGWKWGGQDVQAGP